MKNLLLISNSTNYGEAYLGWPMAEIELFVIKNHISEALFIPFAGVSVSYDEYERKVAKAFEQINVKIISIHKEMNPIDAVKSSKCIIVGGGNTFHLVYQLHKMELMIAIKEKVEHGTPYIGWSAGSNIASPTLRTTNDMPIVMPESFDCLNLIPFQINPHYLDANQVIDNMIKHGGETREDRINEFLILNKNITVVGLREACLLIVENNKIKHKGGKNLRVMKYNQEPQELNSFDELQFLLNS